jgi:GTP-binding protein
MNFNHVTFIKTVVSAKDYPILKNDQGQLIPEIAVAGRSNVGKSSLLNHLFQKKGLVKTSSKPGKTTALNFFSVGTECAFVDLPGYGYAHVPSSVRKQWGPLIEKYLSHREELKLVLFLFDIRRTPNQEDFSLLEWLVFHEVPMILVLTKTDKLNQRDKNAQTKLIMEAFGLEKGSVLLYSVPKNRGRDQLIKIIEEKL